MGERGYVVQVSGIKWVWHAGEWEEVGVVCGSNRVLLLGPDLLSVFDGQV